MATTSRRTRRLSKANAARAKAGGAGSSATMTKTTTSRGLLGGIIGGIKGGLTGGPIGAIGGAVEGLFGGGGGDGRARGTQLTAPGGCPKGTIRFGGNCVDPSAVLPGGRPGVFPESGTPVGGGCPDGAPRATTVGSFGLPAAEPCVETRIHRSCGPGMVLGKDNLCYPRQVLSRRSRFRKWRQPPRPPVTSGDVKAIRRAARTRDRVKELAKDVGFKTPKRK